MKYQIQKIFFTLGLFWIISIWIAQWWSGLIASPGDIITATKWNEMIGKIHPLYSSWWLTGVVWVGDSSPDHKFDVAGNIGLNSSSYINFWDTDGTTGYGFRDNGWILQFKNNAGSWINIPTTWWVGDDLGNHTASQNIALSNFWLSGDGNDEWISIDATWKVGIWTTNPLKWFHFQNGGISLLTGAFWDGMIYSTNNVAWARIFLENLNGGVNLKSSAWVNEAGTTYLWILSDDGALWQTQYAINALHSNGNIWIGLAVPNTKLDINGDVALRLWADYATTGLANNVSLWWGTSSNVRYTGTNTWGLTGIAGWQNGKVLTLHNASNFVLTLVNDSTSSLAWNRIYTTNWQSLAIIPNNSVELVYDSTASRWRVIDGTPQRYVYSMTVAQTYNNVAMTDVTSFVTWTLPVWAYKFNVVGKFRTVAITTGIWMTITQKTAVITNVAWKFRAQVSATADQAYSIIASGTNVTSTAVPVANTDYTLTMDGTFEVTTAGTVAIQMRSEVALSNVTLQPGTFLQIEPLY